MKIRSTVQQMNRNSGYQQFAMTIPAKIAFALRVSKGDIATWEIQDDGAVVITFQPNGMSKKARLRPAEVVDGTRTIPVKKVAPGVKKSLERDMEAQRRMNALTENLEAMGKNLEDIFKPVNMDPNVAEELADLEEVGD